jgi:hypothetical protein
MKSKKCENKESAKLTSKGKKKSVDSLKKVMTTIEKQLKQEPSSKNRKEEEIIRNAILKNKTNNINFCKKDSVDSYKCKSSQRLNKYYKTEISSSMKKMKTLQSPEREYKHKISEQATTSSNFGRSIQDSIKKDIKSQAKRRQRKENEKLVS